MKFIVDNQLPVALAEHLRDRGLDCQHVLEAGLGDAADSAICRHAELQGRIIISKGSKRVGSSLAGRILIVVYTQRRLKHGQELIRIISAREATRKERQAYSG